MMSAVERKLRIARAVARELDAQRLLVGTLIAGSLPAGLGNEHSDADIFAILKEGAVAPDTRQMRVGEDRIDIEWYEHREFENRLTSVTEFVVRADSLAQMWPLESNYDLVSRLSQCEVVTDRGGLAELVESVTSRSTALRPTFTARWSLGFSAGLEDFRGAVAEKDLETAVYLGQGLVIAAGKAIAAGEGDLYFGRKWMFRQLRRGGFDSSVVDHLIAQQRGDWAAGGLDAAADLICLCQTLCAIAQLKATGLDVRLTSFATSKCTSIRRPESAVLIALTGGRFLVHEELGRQFEVGAMTAVLWSLASLFDHRSSLLDAAARILDFADARPKADALLDHMLKKGMLVSADGAPA